jgi:DNA transposition AAA+ family ATPase
MTTKNTEIEIHTDEHGNSDDHALISVSGDQVGIATRDLSEEHRDQIRWIYNWARDNRWTSKVLESETKISWTTLYRVFTGKYAASLENVVTRIRTYRKLAEERAKGVGIPFIETSISRKIWKAAEYALISQSMAFVYGEPQIGKTTALEEYAARNNHGQTKMIRMPASAGVQLMMQEFARACYISANSCFDKLRERVLNAIDGGNLVIIDELHQVFLSYQRGSAIKCLEVIREIHDRTKCGMLLCGTLQLRKELMLGSHTDLLEQFKRRGVLEINLPTLPPKSDINAIARAFGLPPATDCALEIQTDIIKRHGLGKFTKFLQTAQRIAARQNQLLSWDHFLQAHDGLAKLSAGSN